MDDTGADPLVELETDLAAVDTALGSLDQIELAGRTGEAAVAEILAAVSPDRFDRPAPGAVPSDAAAAAPSGATGSELVGDGLVDEQVDPGPEVPGTA